MRCLSSFLLVLFLACAALLLPTGPAGAGQGTGSPALTVSPATLPNGSSTIQVTGTDYLVPPSAEGTSVAGGVYLFFGWVAADKKWGPSARNANNGDGNYGVTYVYPGEAGGAPAPGEQQTSTGSTTFVGFSPSTDPAAPSPFMDRNGNWTATLTVPGTTFTSQLPSGDDKTFNCRVDKCGVFTIGAHGRVSATNEKFTPVTFAAAAGSPTPTTPTPTPKPSATPTPKPAATPTPKATSSTATPTPTPHPDAPGDTNDDLDDGTEPLPKTGIDESSTSGSELPPTTPLDGQIVAIGVDEVSDTGTGGGLALFGVATLAALVMALTIALFSRYGARTRE